MELLLGCGRSREKKLSTRERRAWTKLVTLDINPDCEPDIVGDASDPAFSWFPDDTFDEVHAYDVMEHFGTQGDWRYFFDHWSGIWRILKDGGLFCGISPDCESRWAWGDPGHTRIMGPEQLVYLSQEAYAQQVGQTPMTDYRFYYKADFSVMVSQVDPFTKQHSYILKANKQKET
jgi:hypothetical protein